MGWRWQSDGAGLGGFGSAAPPRLSCACGVGGLPPGPRMAGRVARGTSLCTGPSRAVQPRGSSEGSQLPCLEHLQVPPCAGLGEVWGAAKRLGGKEQGDMPALPLPCPGQGGKQDLFFPQLVSVPVSQTQSERLMATRIVPESASPSFPFKEPCKLSRPTLGMTGYSGHTFR